VDLIRKGDIIGELEFLLSGNSLCTVVASGRVILQRIEGYYLDVLFYYNPTLAGRFYNHLAQSIKRKIYANPEENNINYYKKLFSNTN